MLFGITWYLRMLLFPCLICLGLAAPGALRSRSGLSCALLLPYAGWETRKQIRCERGYVVLHLQATGNHPAHCLLGFSKRFFHAYGDGCQPRLQSRSARCLSMFVLPSAQSACVCPFERSPRSTHPTYIINYVICSRCLQCSFFLPEGPHLPLRKKSENVREGQILELRVMPNNGVPWSKKQFCCSLWGWRLQWVSVGRICS